MVGGRKTGEITATLSTKGQIVIAKSLRERLALRPKQQFRVKIEKGKIILEPIPTLKQLKGTLKELAKGKTTEELIREIKKGWT